MVKVASSALFVALTISCKVHRLDAVRGAPAYSAVEYDLACAYVIHRLCLTVVLAQYSVHMYIVLLCNHCCSLPGIDS